MRHFSFKSSKPICEANEAPSKLYSIWQCHLSRSPASCKLVRENSRACDSSFRSFDESFDRFWDAGGTCTSASDTERVFCDYQRRTSWLRIDPTRCSIAL